ncbi:transcriptional regulator [Rhizobium leguminosarum bv. trifolii]|uniref:helix-turn-helix transcriptional regulator n=1 Tax=Rhizobium leguminosarum TaxID=384 RepID=UPI000E2EB60B|nr:YafY family protein [Rhizobium leguminosarum]RFB87548.1 transcriptional regulator [Rhizobium leguminosarum bv. trifolii]
MSKSQRLFNLMQMLRRHRQPVKGADLAREAGVSLRTVYRDIAALQALGASIDGESGVGYVLRPGFVLPPLMFSKEEIQALALGAKWVSRHTDPELARAAADAVAKIGALLPSDLRDELDFNGLHICNTAADAQPLSLPLLRQAFREQRKLQIVYFTPSGERTRRVIWPIGVGFSDNRRIVGAWCELRQDYQMFHVDWVEHAELLSDRYPGRRRSHAQILRTRVG